MAQLPPWIAIPRTDLEAHGEFRLPVSFRVLFGASTITLLVLFVGVVWYLPREPEVKSAIVFYALASLLAVMLAYAASVIMTFGDFVQTSPEELRYVRRGGGVTAIPWSRIESIRGRPLLMRVEVRSSGLTRPIRLELQFERIASLLMILAERTFHLRETPLALTTHFRSPTRPKAAIQSPRRTRWSIEPNGLIARGTSLPFSDIVDVRIAQLGTTIQPRLGVVAHLRKGTSIPLHLGVRRILEHYQDFRLAHRDWVAQSETAPIEPIQILRPPPTSGARRWIAMLVPFAIALAVGVGSAVLRNSDRILEHRRKSEERATVIQAVELFQAHRHAELIELAEAHFIDHKASVDNLVLLHLQALSYHQLKRSKEAIQVYETAIPVVRALDNVHAERWGRLFYEVAALYDADGDTRRAVITLEEGLRLRPVSGLHRALLAAWYQDLGNNERADSLFREVLDATPEGSEPHAVAVRRLALGSDLEPEATESNKLLPRAELTRQMAIALLPINDVDHRIDLTAICLVLEAKLWIPCAVHPGLHLPEEQVLNAERNQYDAERVLKAMHAVAPQIEGGFRGSNGIFVLGVTARDLYLGNGNFVFSASNTPARVGVLSSYRLLGDLPRYWDPEALAGRRIAIQALSTVGTGLGIDRPVSDHCPLAYPNGLEAFLRKRSRLCASTQEARDAILDRLGGERIHPDSRRIAAVEFVHRLYLLD